MSVSASLSGAKTRMSIDNGNEMNGSWTIGWENGDATSGWVSDGYLSNFAMSTFTNDDNATFTGIGKTGDMRLVYPQVIAQESGDLKLDLSSQSVDCNTNSQHNDFGGKNLYMVSDKFGVEDENAEISNLQMNHLLTYVELRVVNDSENALTLTKAVVKGVPSEAIVNFDNLELTGSGESITIDVTNATTLNSDQDTLLIPFSTLPTTFNNGGEVTIDLYFSGDKYTSITKSITEDLEFAAGTHNFFTCNVTSTTNITYTLATINADNFPSSNTWEIADTNATAGSADEFDGLKAALAKNDDIKVVFPNLTTLPSEAFSECSNLTSIEMPEVRHINAYAFQNCSNLTNLDIQIVTNIEDYAFQGCTRLTSVMLTSLIHARDYIFDGCTNLKDVSIYSVYEIGVGAFNNCESLTTLFLPSLNKIQDNAFANCTKLSEMDLPEVTEIGAGAFYGCSELSDISLPEATYIDGGAFSSCVKLSNVDIPKVTEIMGAMFKGCSELVSIDLSNVTKIWEYAFSECAKLCNVNLPEVTYIGAGAFYSCSDLASIELPKATKINDEAFYECVELSNVTLPKATYIGYGAFVNCIKLSNVTLNEALNILERAFEGCSDLASISLPKAVSIGSNAFSLCPSMRDLSIAIIDGAVITSLESNLFGASNTVSENVTLCIKEANLNGIATINGNVLTVTSTSEEYTFNTIIVN